VHDKYTGKPVMWTTGSGPIMLLRLENGVYDVQVTAGGLALSQSLTVFEGVSSKSRVSLAVQCRFCFFDSEC